MLQTEVLASQEVIGSANQRVALQTRLILGGEALKPAKTGLKKIEPSQLQDVAEDTYTKLSSASTNERSNFWQNKSQSDPTLSSFDEQIKVWAKSVVIYMKDEKFQEEDALEMYLKYFGKEDGSSDINLFVEDVLTEYIKPSEGLDYDTLEEHLPEIKKLAGIFGGNSSELIEALIYAKAKLLDPVKKQELITQVNEEKTVDQTSVLRIDLLDTNEDRLLKWLDINSSNKEDPDDDLDIQIIKPSTTEELIKSVEKQIYEEEPVFIQVEQPPKAKDFNIISPTDSEENQRRETFKRKNKLDDNTFVTDLIRFPVPGEKELELYYFNVGQTKSDKTNQYSSCLVMKDKDGQFIPVGHVDYSTIKDNQKEANALMSTINNIVSTIPSEKIPPHLKAIVNHFCPGGKDDVSVKVDERFRGLNFGGSLWYSALAHANLDGIEQINIVGDLTADIKKKGESFYKHLGAQIMLFIDRVGESDEFITSTRLFAPTFLPFIEIEPQGE